jgi:hypothetical protein
MRECNLCGMEFNEYDIDYLLRTQRHNDFHNPEFKGGNRDNNHYNLETKGKVRNMMFGVPEYK